MMNTYPSRSSYTNNIVSSIQMNVQKFGERPLLVAGDLRRTWREVWLRTNRLGHALASLGVEKGDRVALLLNNAVEFPEAFIACAKFGYIVVPINRYLKPHEIAYHLQDSGAKAVIAHTEYVASLRESRGEVPGLHAILVAGGVPSTSASSDTLDSGLYDYEDLIAQGSEAESPVVVDPDDIQMILYTSGTTGRPKGAVRGFRENYHTAIGVCVEWQVRAGDVQLAVAPMYHAAPVAWMLATLVSGGTYAILPKFHPEEVLQAIQRYGVHWLMMVPVMYDRLLALPDDVFEKYDLKTLRTFISGGAPLHTRTKQGIKTRFPQVKLYEFYGSTELGVSTSLRDDDQLRKERSVGLPMPDVELSLRNSEGREVARGEVGLLYSRGLSGFRGYWNAPEKTAEAFIDDGWATVGDLARQDEEGYYYIVDRAKDMIITGGVNVYPVEVEEVIHQMEGVADVAVIGVPDPKWGEAVKAFVVRRAGQTITDEDVIAFCKARLASFKVPKSVDFVDAIPRTQSGKILKTELRKAYWGEGTFQIS